MYYKAFIRVIKSMSSLEYRFGMENVVVERCIEAISKDEVKSYLLNKYPQFFQGNKVYEKETKDQAQFFYVVIYPLYNWEITLMNEGEWACASCGQIHENKYVDRPRMQTNLFGSDKLFCASDDDACLNNYKKEYYKNVELPDDEVYIRADSPNYIYKITEKSSGKSYIGKTRNAPFFRWWNHLKHSNSPFGSYLKQTVLSAWIFEVLEVLPAETQDSEVFRIESEYIQKYDSINNGFNSLISCKSVLNVDNDPSLFEPLPLLSSKDSGETDHPGSIEPCAESIAGMPKSSLHFA